MRHEQYAATVTRGQSYIHLEDSKLIENPRLVVGMLKAHGFSRDPTPDCASGFICSDGYTNPFEYGHIMAWELAGPNVPENIVPQYAEWQGSESRTHRSWRNMEVEIFNLISGHDNQYIFVAIVEYANGGDSYAAQALRFKNWDQLFNWDDYRIPTGFKVYVEPVGSAYGKRLIAAFLTPGALGAGYAAFCGQILAAYGGTPAYTAIWDHSVLPQQDREALIRNVTAFAVENAWEEHGRQRDIEIASGSTELQSAGMSVREADEYAWAPYSPRHDEAYSYIHDHPDEVRNTLETDFNVPHAEAMTVTTATMVYGIYHGNPSKRNTKLWVKRREESLEKRRKLRDKAIHDKRAKTYLRNRGIVI